MQGALLSKINITSANSVLNVTKLLRQQAVYNTLISSCIRSKNMEGEIFVLVVMGSLTISNSQYDEGLTLKRLGYFGGWTDLGEAMMPPPPPPPLISAIDDTTGANIGLGIGLDEIFKNAELKCHDDSPAYLPTVPL